MEGARAACAKTQGARASLTKVARLYLISDSDDRDSNFIDVHVKNVRKKLAAFDSTDWIETVRGVGYRIKTAAEA